MYKLFSILTLVFLPKELMMKPDESDNNSSSGPEFIMPLVLIRTEDKSKFMYPTDIVPEIEKENFIFGTKFSTEKSGKQFFFCGPEPDENADSYDQYCSYELPEPKQGSEVLTCAHEPEPFVLKLTEKNEFKAEVDIACKSVDSGENKEGKMFAFAYEVLSNDNQKKTNFDLYRFCYCEETNAVLFTEHVIAAPRLLNSPLFTRERKQTYTMSDEAFGFFGRKYQKIKNEFEQVKAQKAGKKRHRELIEESSITSQFLLSDQKLVPSDDMAFALWRKATFHYLNIREMKDEKMKLWDHISQLIREDAISKSVEYHILTGAFNLSDFGKDNNKLIKSPDLWIKVVHYKWEKNDMEYNKSLAIIMNHNEKSNFVVGSLKHLCKDDLCKDTFTKKFPIVGNSVCCTGSTKRVSFYFEFGLKFHEHTPLTIDTFYK